MGGARVRRGNDFYETDPAHVGLLLEWVTIPRYPVPVCEPCVGEWAIGNQLQVAGCDVRSNDLDPARRALSHVDARDIKYPYGAWVVTNPPFKHAYSILQNAVAQGCRVALLLRLSFLEPTQERGAWLAANPPRGLLVLPRHSFTGDGRTDSVTCAWMLWNVDPVEGQPRVLVAPPRPARVRSGRCTATSRSRARAPAPSTG